MRFSITRKIALPFILIIILMSVEGILAILELNKARNGIAYITRETMKERTADKLKSDVASMLMAVNNFIVTGNGEYRHDYTLTNKKLTDRIAELEKFSLDTSEWQHLYVIQRNIDSLHYVARKIFTMKQTRINLDAIPLMKKMDFRYGANVYGSATLILDTVVYHAKATSADISHSGADAFAFFTIFWLAAVLIAIAVVFLTMRRISSPILELVGMARRIAARDFSSNLPARTEDEIGMLTAAFNAMSSEIRRRYEELENFAYIVAHDLKSPLASVIGMTEIISTDFSDKMKEEGREFLRDIVASAKRMSSLISDLLEFARAGKVEFATDPVPMRELLEEVRQDLAYLLKTHNVTLSIPEELPSCYLDRVRFSQVWKNLISNSIKYNDKPAPLIEVSVRDDKDNESMYCFSIRDNGIGIEESELGKIFMPFQRAVKGSEYEGTGIGLAIVKRVIEYHGGRVWAESVLHEGTTFFFTIPKPFKGPVESSMNR